MKVQPVLIGGQWSASIASQTFQAVNPSTRETLPEVYPVSPWEEIERALQAAAEAARVVQDWPGSRFARFLERYAERLEARKPELVARAHAETGLPAEGRLAGAELPRTVNQLRQAAAAARTGSWRVATLDTKANLRSMYGPLGPVCVFGPNNFPFAFNGAAGGDFAAAIAAGNPVIAKGHPSHPGTTQLLAEEAFAAARDTEMPPALVQLIYRTSHADGARLVSNPLIGATGYTGGRSTGLALKEAADRAGKPIYLELSSINPVLVLPGALAERGDKIADEFATSCLMGCGQFCTNPGLVLLIAGDATEQFIRTTTQKFQAAAVGTMLGAAVEKGMAQAVDTLRKAGAEVLAGGEPGPGPGFGFQNTLLRVSGAQFLAAPETLQTEAFGNSSLLVVAADAAQFVALLEHLEGNLTGTIYSSTTGQDDPLYDRVAPLLRRQVGRLLNDKMPTGVAVSPAMNHGGPYPATGHPGFTAVGIPTAMTRFGMLQCYDNVREGRLPAALRNQNPGGMWRLIDGQWTLADAT
jgi:NADP-dependent aldehyde dehydrogenase